MRRDLPDGWYDATEYAPRANCIEHPCDFAYLDPGSCGIAHSSSKVQRGPPAQVALWLIERAPVSAPCRVANLCANCAHTIIAPEFLGCWTFNPSYSNVHVHCGEPCMEASVARLVLQGGARLQERIPGCIVVETTSAWDGWACLVRADLF